MMFLGASLGFKVDPGGRGSGALQFGCCCDGGASTMGRNDETQRWGGTSIIYGRDGGAALDRSERERDER